MKTRSFKNIYIKLLTYTICVENFINIGYWLKIGAYEIQYSEGLIGILSIMSFIVLLKKPFDKRAFFYGSSLLFSVLMSIILLVLFPLDYGIVSYGMSWREYFLDNTVYPVFSMQSIKMMIRIVLFILISIASFSIVKKDDLEKIIKNLVNFGALVISFTVLEFIVKNLIRSSVINQLTSWFFGVGESTLTKLLERDNIYSLQGLMREPSHLAIAFFWFGLIIIFSGKHPKIIKRFLMFVYVCLLLSRSFAAILYILALLTIYSIVNNKQIKYLLLAILISPVLFMSDFFLYYLERVYNVIALSNLNNASITMSEHVRMISIIENVRILIKRPLWGIGLGTSYAHGAIPSLLSNIGALGFGSWILFIFSGLARLKLNKKNFTVIGIFLLSWFFTGDLGAIYAMPLLLFALIMRFNNNFILDK